MDRVKLYSSVNFTVKLLEEDVILLPQDANLLAAFSVNWTTMSSSVIGTKCPPAYIPT